MNNPHRTIRDKLTDAESFRLIFLLTLSFEMIAFLDVVFLAFKCAVLTWGFFILIHNCFINKLAFKVKYGYLLFSFLAIMIITSIVHVSLWIIPNMVIMGYTAICFFMFFGMYIDTSYQNAERELVYVFKFFIFFGLIGGLASLCTLFLNNEFCFCGYYLGIYRNRLIGIYTNSNILAFSMIEAIVACDMLSSYHMRHKLKDAGISLWVIVATVITCCLCLFLSDSNASFLFLILYSTIRVFCNLFFRSPSTGGVKFVKSVMITIAFCIIAMSLSFTFRSVCQRFIGGTITGVHKQEEMIKNFADGWNLNGSVVKLESKEENEIKSVVDENDRKDEIPDLTIGRHEPYDVSSGRKYLFKQGVEIFKHHPVIGMGRANLIKYSKKYMPGGLIHPDLHNGYLTILVCYGAVGFIIFALFSFLVAIDICKYMLLNFSIPNFGVITRLFSALVAYCGYCVFEKAILFDMTFMVGFFWFILGVMMTYVYGERRNM